MASPDAIEALLDRVHEPPPDAEAEMAETTEIEPMADPDPVFLVDAVDEDAPEVVEEMPSVAFIMDAFAKPWDEEPAFPESKDEPEQAEEAVFEQEPPHLRFEASTSSVLDEPADDEASWTSRLELVDELLGDEEPETLEAEIFGLAPPEEPESTNLAVFELSLPPTAEIVEADVEPAVEEYSEPPVAEVTETDVFELSWPPAVEEYSEPPVADVTETDVFELSWPPTAEIAEVSEEPTVEEDSEPPAADVTETDVFELAAPEEATDAESFSVTPEDRDLADAARDPNLDMFGIDSQPPVAADDTEEPAFEEEPEPQIAAAEVLAEDDPAPAFEAASPVHYSVHAEHVFEEPPAFHVEPEAEPDAFAEAEIETRIEPEQELAVEPEAESDAFAEAEIETRIEPEQELAVEPEAGPEQRGNFDTVVEHVLAAGASTLHFSPHGSELAVRARVDGFVRDLGTASHDERDALIARLEAEGVARTHVVTTSRGEKTTLFIRERAGTPASLGELGLDSDPAALLGSALGRPSGAIIVCGPTGSGTTTTLYTALEALATPDRIVTTVEQPVHRLLEGVDQIEVDAANGVTFARALHELRFVDTDAVLVGEIGDREVADLALGAAYEGRFVLAGFRAPSAAAAILRLADMGVEPATLAASLGCVVSQRLVRTVCTECRETYYASEEELSALDQPESGSPRLLVRGAGCSSCNGSGFRGRTGLFEVMPVTEGIRELIADGASAKKVQKAAVAAGMRTLRDEGIRLCLDGVTAATEVARVLRDDS
jgi:type II secretory ATPase GspE/PulE/Tfp pilus assembly ATPase PilB-like protein